jgi:hypothetical protein
VDLEDLIKHPRAMRVILQMGPRHPEPLTLHQFARAADTFAPTAMELRDWMESKRLITVGVKGVKGVAQDIVLAPLGLKVYAWLTEGKRLFERAPKGEVAREE